MLSTTKIYSILVSIPYEQVNLSPDEPQVPSDSVANPIILKSPWAG